MPPLFTRRAWLRSFWLIVSTSIGLAVGVLLAALVSYQWVVIGIALALILALPGMLQPRATVILYKAWNKLARSFSRIARLYLTSVIFYIIFVAVGSMGTSLRLTRPSPAETGWKPRQTQTPATYLSQYNSVDDTSPQKGFARFYLSWAARSGNPWAISLLPFLVLLAALDDELPGRVPSDTYTLF